MSSLNMPKGFEGQRVYLSHSTKEVYVLGGFGFAFFVSGFITYAFVVWIIFLHYFTKRCLFDYYIIFYLFFDFQCGYGTTERSEFILTEDNG